MSDGNASGDSEREGHIIDGWFICPVCGSSDVRWDVDFEHLSLACTYCGTSAKEWIEDITSGRTDAAKSHRDGDCNHRSLHTGSEQ